MATNCASCHRVFAERFGAGQAPRSLTRPRLCYACCREAISREQEARLGPWGDGLIDLDAVTSKQANFARNCRTDAIVKLRDALTRVRDRLPWDLVPARCVDIINRHPDARFWIDNRFKHPVRERTGERGYLADELAASFEPA